MPATVPYRVADEPVSGYRLVEFLGRGGFGEVWKAVGPGGILIALKLIRLDEVAGHKELRALRLVKRLRHPNLVPILAYWLKDENGKVLDDDAVAALAGAPSAAETARWSLTPGGAAPVALTPPSELIIAMGLGETNLHQRLRQQQSEGAYGLPDDELFPHLLDAARGIDYLNRPVHDLGGGPVAIQHCDIKPQNMLVVGGALQLCDFGLASMLGDVRTTSTAAGTIAYAAPECFRDGKPSSATDQYSLAVTYYELKTGSLPYQADSVAQVSQAILQGKLDFSRVSLAEQQVLRRATALDPKKRYRTATEMADALRQTVPGISESAATLSFKRASSRRMRRAGLAAGIATVALLGGLFAWRAPWQQWVATLAGRAEPTTARATTASPARETASEAITPAPGESAPADQSQVSDVSPPAAVEPPQESGSQPKPEQAQSAPPPGAAAGTAAAPELINSLGMKLALVPAGTFSMGTDENVEELAGALGPLPTGFDNADEHPAHVVQISRPCYVGTTEVTLGQFRQFVDATGYKTDAQRDGQGGWGYDAQTKMAAVGPQYNWSNCGFAQDEKSPVVNVSWNDATAFCDWLSRKEGRSYRLPTEAEWEYAGRAGTTTRFHNGDTPEVLRRVANVLDRSTLEALPAARDQSDMADPWVFTAPVASLAANSWGLFDIHGNVAEWCADWYAKAFYDDSPPADPTGPAEGQYHLLRGGGWIHPPVRCRSAYRGFESPDFRSGYVGFRVLCEP